MNTKKAASFIKSNRPKVVSFLIKHGQAINKKDTDVKLGMKVMHVIEKDKNAEKEFYSLSGLNFSAADASTETGSGNLAVELINSGIQKHNTTYVKEIILVILVLVAIYYLFKK